MKLYGFEPEPKNIALLKNRIHDNRFNLFEGVMSDTNDELTFNRSRSDNPDDLSFSGSIMKPKNHLAIWDWIHFDETITVPSVTLDGFCQQHTIPVIDFIWCDSQGAEEKIILGGKEAFEKKVRYFILNIVMMNNMKTSHSCKEYWHCFPLLKLSKILGKDYIAEK